MSGLQEKLETAIRGTLMDPEGAGSDLEFCREIGHPWVHLEGNLDVQHLASHVIDTLEVEYEYAVQRSSLVRPDRLFIVGNYWGERDERGGVYEALRRTHGPISYKLVRRRKAGPIEDA